VRELRCVPVVGLEPGPPRAGSAGSGAFVTTYRPLSARIAEPGRRSGPVHRLSATTVSGSRRTAGSARALRTDEAVDALLAVWAELHGSAPLSMRDAVDATELIEHLLRPLSAPVVEADICHAVSNGLPALVGLAAKLAVRHPDGDVRTRRSTCASATWPCHNGALLLAGQDDPARRCFAEFAGRPTPASDVIKPGDVYNQRGRCATAPTRTRSPPPTTGSSPTATRRPSPSRPCRPSAGSAGSTVEGPGDPAARIRASVRAELPSVVLRLFGPTPPGNHGTSSGYRTLADELGLAGSVTFEGPVRRSAGLTMPPRWSRCRASPRGCPTPSSRR